MWLLFLMLSATVTGTIITRYENAFSAVPLLVSFIPMLMDTGGNCGSQSSTLIIRGLALNEIRPRDVFRIAFKEFRIALLVGTGPVSYTHLSYLLGSKNIAMIRLSALSTANGSPGRIFLYNSRRPS